MKKVFGILILALLMQCRRDEDLVPFVAVDLYLNINEPQFFDLYPIGGWIYYTGGSRGLIVYRKSMDEFMVYDRHSPYNVGAGCIVEVDQDGILINDPCSDSQWIITDGSLVSGPASTSLTTYETTFVDPNLHIYN